MICHGTSDRQVQAISDAIEERLKKSLDRRPSHVEGRQTAEWILMDYIDFVVHIFLEERRGFYRLESLWGDAPRVRLDEPSEARPGAATPAGGPSASG